ncbi:MAG: hypothetical protein F6J87_17435 [Spirulina sp. SIO3F2]|nr:hypothetical protein [Spirulina sp. SIO3F2]
MTSQSPSTTGPVTLDAAGYEFLWTQLLEGAANGWDRHRMQKFFAQIEDRATIPAWLDWLGQFGKKVLASPTPNLELARRLILVATHLQHLPQYEEVALLANHIAHELRQRATSGVVWDYDGPDR